MSAVRHEIPIGNHVFYIRRFPALQALEILGDLQKQIAGPLLATLDGKAGGSDAVNQAAMMQAFSKLSEKLDGKTLRSLAERLLHPEYVSVSIDGAEVRKLDVSAQNLALETAADVLTLCWGIVQHNYAEVLARLSVPTGPGLSRPANQLASFDPNWKPN